MKTWDHMVVDLSDTKSVRGFDGYYEERDASRLCDGARETLSDHGHEGWELVAVWDGYAFLKREVPS